MITYLIPIVGCWAIGLFFIWCLCRAAARGDETV